MRAVSDDTEDDSKQIAQYKGRCVARLILLGFPLVSSLLLASVWLAIPQLHTYFPDLGEYAIPLAVIIAADVLVNVVISWIIWVCPYCKASLGLSWAPDSCPECAKPLHRHWHRPEN